MSSRACSSCISGPTTTPSSSPGACVLPSTRQQARRADFESKRDDLRGHDMEQRERGHIGDLVRYFLRLGFLGFGGPVALVGQMERELVDDKKWLDKSQMREAIAICQSLPGP